MSREIMQQALDALKYHTKHTYPFHQTNVAIELLKKELAKPEQDVTFIDEGNKQEPVAWRNAAIRLGEDLYSVGPNGYYDMTAKQWLDWALSVVNTAPSRKEWVGLTEGELIDIKDCNRGFWTNAAKIEQLLKEKNT